MLIDTKAMTSDQEPLSPSPMTARHFGFGTGTPRSRNFNYNSATPSTGGVNANGLDSHGQGKLIVNSLQIPVPGCVAVDTRHTPRSSNKSRPNTPKSRKKARKPKKPQKSASCWDPNFRGVTLWFTTLLDGDKTQLRISSFFSKTAKKRDAFLGTKCRRQRHESVSECKSSSESEDSRETFPTMNYGAKTCASCGTRRTPLWRDAEDGTPLCNACGIRYRKYRVRCSKCWHIPKKDSKAYPSCSICSGMLRFQQQRKIW